MFSMQGRIGRANFFFTILGLTVACYVAAFATGMLLAGTDITVESFPAIGPLISIPFIVLYAFAVVRRLHDLDRPGSHYWLFLVPLYNLYLLLILLFHEGTKGENSYGPMP